MKHRIGTALAIAAFGLIGVTQQPSPAQAAITNYCGGRIVMDGVARSVESDGQKANVIYTAFLRNTTGSDIRYVINTARVGGRDVTVYHSPAMETSTAWTGFQVKFYTERVDNPSGNGALAEGQVVPLINMYCYN